MLTPAREPLIARSFEAVAGAKRVIMHLYNATAPMMRKIVLGLDVDGVVALASSHARIIRDLAADRPETDWRFEYSPEMFSDTELEVSRRVIDAVTDVWQPTPQRTCIINLPTTVEHSTPNVYADMIEWTCRNIQRRDSVVISAHPHNDRGTGVAATELGDDGGRGPRGRHASSAMASAPEIVDIVVVALNLNSAWHCDGQLDFSDLDEIHPQSSMNCVTQPDRCIRNANRMWANSFSPSFSGSHQDAIKKAFAARREGDIWEMPYLPIDPKDLGRSYEAIIRVNSQSGKGGIAYLLESEYGLELPRRLQIEFSQAVQAVMDAQGREVSASDIWTIFESEYRLAEGVVTLSDLTQTDVGDGQVRVAVEATVMGRRMAFEGSGNGPVDAFVDGLSRAAGVPVKVLNYHEHSIGGGAQARAAAYLEVRVGDAAPVFGVGIDANIVRATLLAVLSASSRGTSSVAVKPVVAHAIA